MPRFRKSRKPQNKRVHVSFSRNYSFLYFMQLQRFRSDACAGCQLLDLWNTHTHLRRVFFQHDQVVFFHMRHRAFFKARIFVDIRHAERRRHFTLGDQIDFACELGDCATIPTERKEVCLRCILRPPKCRFGVYASFFKDDFGFF